MLKTGFNPNFPLCWRAVPSSFLAVRGTALELATAAARNEGFARVLVGRQPIQC